MGERILPVEAIQERDIDILILEELTVDIAFGKWLTMEMNFPKLTEYCGAWKSISDYGLGETDILFSYKSKSKRIYVLIENKLDASFQNNQFERYTKRAAKYIEDNECDLAFVILIAPKLYCDSQSKFERNITYEQISAQLELAGTKRAIFKCKLLNIASEKLRRGYKPVNSIQVQKFWLSYWKFKEANFPNLIMKKPDIVPINSDWPMLYDKELPDVILYHKLAQGHIDATFRGFSKDIEHKLNQNLPKNATLVNHSKSFSIRINTGKCDRMKTFEVQQELVNEGLKTMEKLRSWLRKESIFS